MNSRVIVGLSLAVSLSAQIAYPGSSPQRETRTTQASAPKKRHLPKPQDPEAVALFIHLMDRYAQNLRDQSDLDRRFEQELAKRSVSREAARKMVANFKRIPVADRRAVLGQWSDVPTTTRIPLEQYRSSFQRLATLARNPQSPRISDDHTGITRRSLTPKHSRSEQPGSTQPDIRKPDPRNPNRTRGVRPATTWSSKPSLAHRPAFAVNMQNRYVLRYEGIWCHSETDVDHGTDSDEIYVVTNVIDSAGNTTTTTHPNPHEPPWYEDLDDDETRKGPTRGCWGGADGRVAQDLTLVVSVFESDGGDPGTTAASFAVAAGFAAVVCAFSGPVNCALAWVAATVFVGAIALLTGGDDDLVSVETVSISAAQLRDWADDEPRLKKGRIPYHFSTVHDNGGSDVLDGPSGADYHVYFTFSGPSD